MKRWKKVLIRPETSILETLRVIDDSGLEIALVVDPEETLLGTVTDGDIRRAILRSISLQDPVKEIMNHSPVTATLDTPEDQVLFLMSQRLIKQLPILDSRRHVVDLRLLRDLTVRQKRENCAVIMAGGLGRRLGDLTRNMPKPLLPVGSQPLLGTIVRQLRKHGFWKLLVAVNYRSSQIKDYLGDGSEFDVQIQYIEESDYLGTAGALSLAPEPFEKPFLVVNGDILSTVNYANLMQFHEGSGKAMTACTREFRLEIPFGIVKTKGTDLVQIKEKPSYHFLVNAGIYVLNPSTLNDLEPGRKMDMPQLIMRTASKGWGVGCFPLTEFWLDIGKLDDYQRAQSEFANLFQDDDE
jgi:dTDP-glucose pyrophosphorylase/predicted transcriptional regulator